MNVNSSIQSSGSARRKRPTASGQQRLRSLVLGRHYFMIQMTLIVVIVSCILAWFWLHLLVGLRQGDTTLRPVGQPVDDVVDEDHPSSFVSGREKDMIFMQQPHQANSRIDTVVTYLMNLAKLPPQQLWDIFGMDDSTNHENTARNSYGKDPFSLRELEQGKCPAGLSTAEWLPPRPWNSAEISAMFRKKAKELQSGRGARSEGKVPVLVWYEHMSKAGGTTFCGLARTNLGKDHVPRYFCMPKKLNSTRMDGRVGSWTNDELIEYTTRESHLIVANEWDPFDLDKFQLSGRSLDGNKLALAQYQESPRLLFVTTLRDPLDRLLSAYNFFGAGESPADFAVFLKRNFGRIHKFQVGAYGTFRCNAMRYNAITWRYSGGNLQHRGDPTNHQQKSLFPPPMTDEKLWRDPFETAIRALSQQDLILPIDVMSKEEGQEALRRLLGWEQVAIKGKGTGDKKNGHIVTTGEIQNSNAREYLSEDDYRFLWDANWLDNILLRWCRAVFLARLHCEDA